MNETHIFHRSRPLFKSTSDRDWLEIENKKGRKKERKEGKKKEKIDECEIALNEEAAAFSFSNQRYGTVCLMHYTVISPKKSRN